MISTLIAAITTSGSVAGPGGPLRSRLHLLMGNGVCSLATLSLR